MLYEMYLTSRSTRSEKVAAQRTAAETETYQQNSVAMHKESGARPLIICDSGWADERYPNWGVTVFPNLEARIKQYELMNKYGLFQVDEPALTLLGTAFEEPQPANIQPGWVYLLWMMYTNPVAIQAYSALSKEAQAELFDKRNSAIDRSGGCSVISCYSYWANDAYAYFGVETFPNLEALQGYKAELDKINWSMYAPATSILGMLSPLQALLPTVFD